MLESIEGNTIDYGLTERVSIMAVAVETPDDAPKVKTVKHGTVRAKSTGTSGRNLKDPRGGSKPKEYARPPSQLPEDGWFRATTDESRSPPTSESPTSSGSSTSDDDSESAASESEELRRKSARAARKTARYIRKRKGREEQKRIKKPMNWP
jgi:hypothetical protein